MKRRSFTRRRAFTLLEIMLVVAIIALLLSTGFYFLGRKSAIGQDTKIGGGFQVASTQALQTYEDLNGYLPTTEQGLQALVTMPQSPTPSRQRGIS